MLKIGHDKEITYINVPKDKNGWVDASKYRPMEFDLCMLKIKNKRCKLGWFSGSIWDGLNLEPSDEIIAWKRQKEP